MKEETETLRWEGRYNSAIDEIGLAQRRRLWRPYMEYRKTKVDALSVVPVADPLRNSKQHHHLTFTQLLVFFGAKRRAKKYPRSKF